ncbi:MAG: hypothetical protein KTR35_05845, partial [Gammaproteobacteria bacterium]|nr:hypothetical protein [Gammaproteobacteria bacterium]
GYWPHAALYIGTPKQREELEISVNHSILEKWTSGISTMEALKDGVKLRPLVETLEVDACVVLRPMLSKQGIRTGIERIVKHEGKRYNFDFDFFRSDCLVCTEVVYRAFDGVEGLEFVLSERAGRKSVSAEDFLDMALEGELLHVVAMYGYPLKSSEILTGERARELLAESYKS